MPIALIVVPVVFLLLFVYILGGPIGAGLGNAGRGAPYVDVLLPGNLMMTVAAGCGSLRSTCAPT
jgi:ABC-2 type transport system permease protein